MAEKADYPPLNELLGYPKDARLLIVNADDTGLCEAENLGVLDVFQAGMVKSCSVIMPAPAAAGMTRVKKDHPFVRCGVHLTVTSEWEGYRWGPLSPKEEVPSLLDQDGYFYRSEHDFLQKAAPEEVESEFRAQIQRAFELELEPTHIDSHMGAYHWDERFFRVAKALAEEFDLTMRVAYAPRRDVLRQEKWAVVDRLIWDTWEVPIPDRVRFYRETISRLIPGVTEILIHPARADEQLWKICGDTAAHRVFDRDFYTQHETKAFLEQEGIICIGYHDLQQLQRQLR